MTHIRVHQVYDTRLCAHEITSIAEYWRFPAIQGGLEAEPELTLPIGASQDFPSANTMRPSFPLQSKLNRLLSAYGSYVFTFCQLR